VFRGILHPPCAPPFRRSGGLGFLVSHSAGVRGPPVALAPSHWAASTLRSKPASPPARRLHFCKSPTRRRQAHRCRTIAPSQSDRPGTPGDAIAFDGTRSRGGGHRDDSFSSRAGGQRAIAMATSRSSDGATRQPRRTTAFPRSDHPACLLNTGIAFDGRRARWCWRGGCRASSEAITGGVEGVLGRLREVS
jgi:hypothetical protein